jgi:hypothetical protein
LKNIEEASRSYIIESVEKRGQELINQLNLLNAKLVKIQEHHKNLQEGNRSYTIITGRTQITESIFRKLFLMQEQQHQIKIYGFLQKAVYAVVALDCASLFYLNANIPVVSNLLKNFSK